MRPEPTEKKPKYGYDIKVWYFHGAAYPWKYTVQKDGADIGSEGQESRRWQAKFHAKKRARLHARGEAKRTKQGLEFKY